MVNMSDMWHSLPPETYPITGICIVADKSKCPPGYSLVEKTCDGEDADIWKDSFFSRRVTRYFCITRIFPQDYGRINNVVTAIVIVNTAEELPEGFTQIEWTHDSREKATRKRVCGVKMTPRGDAVDAICEIALTSAAKKTPPFGFSMIGDMDGPNLCFKMGKVPSHTKGQGQDASGAPSNDAEIAEGATAAAPLSVEVSPSHQPTPLQLRTAFHTQTSETSFLDGVTFALNSKYAPNNSSSKFDFPQPRFKSAEEIEEEFSYVFTNEYELIES